MYCTKLNHGHCLLPCRVCIVNNHGTVLMDKFARPKERVTDFRTRFSGIRPADIRSAPAFEEVQKEAAAILKNRVIVGHSISNDLKVRHTKVHWSLVQIIRLIQDVRGF